MFTITFIKITGVTFVVMKTIQVTDEFHSYLATHGRFGERMEDIILRIAGDKFKIPTGDRPTETYSPDDVDSKKTKIKRRANGNK